MAKELVQGWTEFSPEVGTNRYRDVTYRVYREDGVESIDVQENGIAVRTIPVDPNVVPNRESYEQLIQMKLSGS